MSTETADGGKQIKIIDPEDFASAMANQSKVETGLLPANARYFASNGQLSTIILETKPHVRKLYILREHLDVPIPGCLMQVTTVNEKSSNKSISQTYFHCYTDPVLSRNTELYRFPFGNVFSDGRICWGSVVLPKLAELYQLGALPELFLNTTFNGHIDTGIFNPFSKEVGDVTVTINRGIQLAKHLATTQAATFPNDVLRKAGYTLGEFIKSSSKT
jgi:hypothetical protein